MALWKDEYRTGVGIIDEQHHQLFDKIEHLLEIVKGGNRESNRRECMEIIDFLVKYTINIKILIKSTNQVIFVV